MMLLEIKNLTKHYGSKCALRDFSCAIGPGILGIIGPNGAGKTTLMNLITDNVKRETGEILYDGTDILKLGKSFRRVLGFMPQEQGMYDELSARAFLIYMAGLKEVHGKKAREQVEDLLQLVDLQDAAHRKLGAFSGGMRQRILLAQALLGEPKVVILDEPTVGMDPAERLRVSEYIKEISKERIVLWSTHILSDVEAFADSLLIMDSGKLLAHDTPSGLLREHHAGSLEELYFTLTGA
ncbi:MAG: ATP-binding cassette domain-containing protein [Lachnospiraceae bacterium]|nr:ATP-binding cassette domain-containing protein [Lachnospiraceae bacterium]